MRPGAGRRAGRVEAGRAPSGVRGAEHLSHHRDHAQDPRVVDVIVDVKEKAAIAVVPDDMLSLAIGKKGQNVRLPAKLTGWRIDIKSEEEKRREVEAQLERLEVPGDQGEEGGGEAPLPELVLPDIHDEIVESLRQDDQAHRLPRRQAGVVREGRPEEGIHTRGRDESGRS